MCEQDCSSGWQDCHRQVTWAILWSPGSLPLWPRVPVTALKPLQAPVLLSQFQSRLPWSLPWRRLHGKVGSMSASLLGQKTPTVLPQGPWAPGIPPVISTLPSHPNLGYILRVVPSQESCRGLLFQLLPFKGGDHPSIPTPSLGCPGSLPISTRHSILVHFQSLLPSLEAANQSPRPGKSTQVGLLLDLFRLPPRWQLWTLRAK